MSKSLYEISCDNMKNELKTLYKKINLELDDVVSHMKKNSFESFTDIKDEIYLMKLKNFYEMMYKFDNLNYYYKKYYNIDYQDSD